MRQSRMGEAEICWTVTQEAPYSWQFDLFGEKESVTLASGLGDFEFAIGAKLFPQAESLSRIKCILR